MQQNFYKHAMTYGLFLGLVFSVNFLLSLSKSLWLGMLTYFVMAAIVYLTYRFTCHYRDTEQDGAISYGRSLWYIVVLYIFAAIISSVVKYVYFQFINPDYLDEVLNNTMAVMEQLQWPLQEDIMYDQMKSMLTPINFTLQYIWINMMLGFLVGVVMAAFVKKDKNIFEA